jgi:hypothetical protein
LAVKGIQKCSSEGALEELSGKSAIVSTLSCIFRSCFRVANICYAMLEIMNMEEPCAVICGKKAIFVKNIEFYCLNSVT